MLDKLLDPKLSSHVVDYLLEKGWSVARIAKSTSSTGSFVEKVRRGKERLDESDLQAISRSLKTDPYRLIVAAANPDEMSPKARELFHLTRELVESVDDFQVSLRRKPTAVRRQRAKVA